MPGPNVHVRRLFLSGRNQEAVSRATCDGLAVHTPVLTVFGFTGITGVLSKP